MLAPQPGVSPHFRQTAEVDGLLIFHRFRLIGGESMGVCIRLFFFIFIFFFFTIDSVNTQYPVFIVSVASSFNVLVFLLFIIV